METVPNEQQLIEIFKKYNKLEHLLPINYVERKKWEGGGEGSLFITAGYRIKHAPIYQLTWFYVPSKDAKVNKKQHINIS